MRISKTKSAALLTLFVFAGTFRAYAWESVNVDVPFAFESDGKACPAGTYTVDLDRMRPGTVDLRGSATVVAIAQKTHERRDGTHAILTFRAYGDAHFLAKVQTRNATWTMPRTPKEIELARLAKKNGGELIAQTVNVR